ncbi:hypothetical protein [Streptomyces rishiriensis]|uniref:hypothetical protein n=1 Tax=Streptomyces rishiriensis TaxID=68264 RepID=UPI000D594B76|nr:hypothetical protein [Streptomyces rishiriensis]
MIRTMIVDHQAIVLTGMAMILSVEEGISVVAEAEAGVQAVLAARHRPDSWTSACPSRRPRRSARPEPARHASHAESRDGDDVRRRT